MKALTVTSTQDVTAYTGAGENPFQILFQPAQPTLEAVALMRAPLDWLNRRRNFRSFDPQEVLSILPPEDDIVLARHLFRQAEQESAPEAWTGIAIALMLDATPEAHRVSDAYVLAVVDAMYHDAEGRTVAQGYSYAEAGDHCGGSLTTPPQNDGRRPRFSSIAQMQ